MSEAQWMVWSAETPDADSAKAELARLVDGTVDARPSLWAVTDGGDLAIAVTGCGPNSEAHANMIAYMHSALRTIARGPVMPPPDAGAHSMRAYAEYWRNEAARCAGIARDALAQAPHAATPTTL